MTYRCPRCRRPPGTGWPQACRSWCRSGSRDQKKGAARFRGKGAVRETGWPALRRRPGRRSRLRLSRHGADEFAKGSYRETLQAIDKPGLLEVNEVGLIGGGRLGQIGERRQRRFVCPITGRLANVGVDRALPCVVTGAVENDDCIADGKHVLIGLADGGGVSVERRDVGLESLALEELAQWNGRLAVTLVANDVHDLAARFSGFLRHRRRRRRNLHFLESRVDGGFQFFQVTRDEVSAKLGPRITQQRVDEFLLAGRSGFDTRSGQPDDALQTEYLAVLNGEFVFQNRDGLFAGAIRDDAVKAPDDMHGQLAAGEDPREFTNEAGLFGWELRIRQGGIAVQAQVGDDGLAIVAVVHAAIGHKHRGFFSSRR